MDFGALARRISGDKSSNFPANIQIFLLIPQGNRIYYPTRCTVYFRITDGKSETLLTSNVLSAAEGIWRVA